MNLAEYITPNQPNTKYALSAIGYNKFVINNERQNALKETIQNQYVNFNNLGINLLKNTTYSDENFRELIDFVDKNYLTITNKDFILQTGKQLQILGRYIYELIIVDLPNIILPKILKSQNCLPEALLVLPETDLKTFLFDIVMEYIEVLRQMVSKTTNTALENELIKWSYYLELLDTNLETFITEVIAPIINKYEMQLFAKS